MIDVHVTFQVFLNLEYFSILYCKFPRHFGSKVKRRLTLREFQYEENTRRLSASCKCCTNATVTTTNNQLNHTKAQASFKIDAISPTWGHKYLTASKSWRVHEIRFSEGTSSHVYCLPCRHPAPRSCPQHTLDRLWLWGPVPSLGRCAPLTTQQLPAIVSTLDPAAAEARPPPADGQPSRRVPGFCEARTRYVLQ